MNEWTKELYALKAGEEKKLVNFWVLRVPGGWIFTSLDDTSVSAGVFVSFNTEFMV